MNCANHPDVSAVAYCRTCGKPLCATCTRDVRGVIYCENCLAARVEATLPPTPAGAPLNYVPPPPGYVPGAPASGPNPTVAGILAGFFPMGVGAVYTGQYAKALAHLVIFFGLIWASHHQDLFGLAIAFFYVYQIIDAVRSARAIQLGQPAPDPLGLAHAFGAGEKVDTSKVPLGAIILIGLGVLFLLQTLDIFRLEFDRVWPLFFVALGGWLFARAWGFARVQETRCYCEHCRCSSLLGPAILVTIGVLGFIDSYRNLGFFSWVGALLIVIGVVQLIKNNASRTGHVELPPAAGSGVNPPPAAGGTGADQSQASVNEVRNV
jgi:hypothetical protein